MNKFIIRNSSAVGTGFVQYSCLAGMPTTCFERTVASYYSSLNFKKHFHFQGCFSITPLIILTLETHENSNLDREWHQDVQWMCPSTIYCLCCTGGGEWTVLPWLFSWDTNAHLLVSSVSVHGLGVGCQLVLCHKQQNGLVQSVRRRSRNLEVVPVSLGVLFHRWCWVALLC